MKVHYLEIVASDVDAVCAAYEAAHGIFEITLTALKTECRSDYRVALHSSWHTQRRSLAGKEQVHVVAFTPPIQNGEEHLRSDVIGEDRLGRPDCVSDKTRSGSLEAEIV
jgi:hypothetical protein